MMQGIGSSQVFYPQFFMMGAVANTGAYPMYGQQGYGQSAGAFALMQSQRLEGMYAGFLGGQGYGYQPQMQGGFAFAGVIMPTNMYGAQSSSRVQDDPHGVSQSGQGLKSNLANSPEAMLALKDIFSQGGNKSYDEIAKELKDKYGIQAEVGEISTVDKNGKEVKGKGVKFGNGDFFIDGNGNGVGDTGDYKFDDAVKSLKEKYNLDDKDLTAITDRMKNNAKNGGVGGFGGNYGGGFAVGGFMPNMGMGGTQWPMPFFNPMMNYNWMNLFGAAFQYAR